MGCDHQLCLRNAHETVAACIADSRTRFFRRWAQYWHCALVEAFLARWRLCQYPGETQLPGFLCWGATAERWLSRLNARLRADAALPGWRGGGSSPRV